MASNPQWENAIVEQDSVGECIEISYASGKECHGEDVSHEALRAVLAGLGAKGWDLVAATDAFSPSERRVRSYAFKRLQDEARGIFRVIRGSPRTWHWISPGVASGSFKNLMRSCNTCRAFDGAVESLCPLQP